MSGMRNDPSYPIVHKIQQRQSGAPQNGLQRSVCNETVSFRPSVCLRRMVSSCGARELLMQDLGLSRANQ